MYDFSKIWYDKTNNVTLLNARKIEIVITNMKRTIKLQHKEKLRGIEFLL